MWSVFRISFSFEPHSICWKSVEVFQSKLMSTPGNTFRTNSIIIGLMHSLRITVPSWTEVDSQFYPMWLCVRRSVTLTNIPTASVLVWKNSFKSGLTRSERLFWVKNFFRKKTIRTSGPPLSIKVSSAWTMLTALPEEPGMHWPTSSSWVNLKGKRSLFG